jgi:hypothetical protein
VIPFVFVLPALFTFHAAADTVLQGRFVSYGKDRHHPHPRIAWWILLTWHSGIHAAGVALITGSAWIGSLEFCAHASIDFGKAEKWWGALEDQGLHAFCKCSWTLALIVSKLFLTKHL